MALQISTTYRGLSIPAGYLRFERYVSIDKLHFRAYFELYASADTTTGHPIEGIHLDLPYDLDGACIHQQAYAALKAMPEYVSGVDV